MADHRWDNKRSVPQPARNLDKLCPLSNLLQSTILRKHTPATAYLVPEFNSAAAFGPN
jgi:hypothetical protein